MHFSLLKKVLITAAVVGALLAPGTFTFLGAPMPTAQASESDGGTDGS